MSVQYSAVDGNPTLHMVLYCLTPPEFRRYSSLNLCLPYPARGVRAGWFWSQNAAARIETGSGIFVVNREKSSYLALRKREKWGTLGV